MCLERGVEKIGAVGKPKNSGGAHGGRSYDMCVVNDMCQRQILGEPTEKSHESIHESKNDQTCSIRDSLPSKFPSERPTTNETQDGSFCLVLSDSFQLTYFYQRQTNSTTSNRYLRGRPSRETTAIPFTHAKEA